MKFWETYRAAQTLKRDLYRVARIEPTPSTLESIRQQIGETMSPYNAVPIRRRAARIIALAVVVPALIVVASAATLFPQTAEGADRWLDEMWVEQEAFAKPKEGSSAGVEESVVGISGYFVGERLTWSVHGVARVTVRGPEKLFGGGQTLAMNKDLQMKIARLASPAVASAIGRFQQTYRDNPTTTLTLDGKVQQWQGFGHFEVKNEAGEPVVLADVEPVPN
jgi:hypothetical protein